MAFVTVSVVDAVDDAVLVQVMVTWLLAAAAETTTPEADAPPAFTMGLGTTAGLLDTQLPMAPLLAVRVNAPPALICWLDAAIEKAVAGTTPLQ